MTRARRLTPLALKAAAADIQGGCGFFYAAPERKTAGLNPAARLLHCWEHQSFTRPRYSPVRVSTDTFSPMPTKGGTWIFRPVSSVAGLYWAAAVAPFRAGSVSVTVRVTVAGSSMLRALLSWKVTEALSFSFRYWISSLTISSASVIWS